MKESTNLLQPTFEHASKVTSASLLKILQDKDGIVFVAELERANPGILEALGADGRTKQLVKEESERVYVQSDFLADPFFLTRISEQLEFIKRKVQERYANQIGNL